MADCWAEKDEDAAIGSDRKDRVRNGAIREGAKMYPMATFPTHKIWYAHQEKRTKLHLEKIDGNVAPGEEKKGAKKRSHKRIRHRRGWFNNSRQDMNKYEITSDMM